MEKLYNALFQDGKYTKSFEEFKSQFSNESAVSSLYEALKSDELYTKSLDEFKSQFGFEVKTTPQDSGATVAESQAPDMELSSVDGLSESQETEPTKPISPRMQQRQRELGTGVYAKKEQETEKKVDQGEAFSAMQEAAFESKYYDTPVYKYSIYAERDDIQNRIDSNPFADNSSLQKQLDEINSKIKQQDEESSRTTSYSIAKRRIRDIQSERNRAVVESFNRSSEEGMSADEILSSDENYQQLKQEEEVLKSTIQFQENIINKVSEDTNAGSGALNFFKTIGRATGLYKDTPSQTIELDDKVSEQIIYNINSDSRLQQKISGGFASLQEKEEIIKQAKAQVLFREGKKISDQIRDLQSISEDKIEIAKATVDSLDKELQSILNNAEIVANDQSISDEERRSRLAQMQSDFDNISSKRKEVAVLADSDQESRSKRIEELNEELGNLKAITGFDISKDIIKNNFKKTDQADEFENMLNKDGFFYKAGDVLSTLGEGVAKVLVQAEINFPAYLMSGFFDMFTDQDDYSSFDAFADTVGELGNFNYAPSRTDEESRLVNEAGEWNANAYTISKSIAETLPFTAYIVANTLKGDVGSLEKTFGSFLNPTKSKAATDRINMVYSGFRASYSNNIQEAQRNGLDDNSSRLYANTMSLAEGLSELIFPDAQLVTAVGKASLKKNFALNLKNAANMAAAKSASKKFILGLGLENLEEEVVLATEDLTKMAMVAGHKDSIFWDIKKQKELVGATTAMTGLLLAGNTRSQFVADKMNIYREVFKNNAEIRNELVKLYNEENDPGRKKFLENSINMTNMIFMAVKNSPENVTSKQIDLLVQRQMLEDKKKKTDKAYHQDIDSEISKIDSEIKKEYESARTKEAADLLNQFTENKRRAKSRSPYVDLDSRFSELSEKAKKKKITQEDVDDFLSKFKESDGFKDLTKQEKDSLISAIEEGGISYVTSLLKGNAAFESGVSIMNTSRIESTIKDENASSFAKRMAAISPKHETLHYFTESKGALEGLTEEEIDSAYTELFSKIRDRSNEMLGEDYRRVIARIGRYSRMINAQALSDSQKKRLKYEELINLYADLNNAGYISDEDANSAPLLNRIIDKLLNLTGLKRESMNKDINPIEHIRSFENFYKEKGKRRSRFKTEGGLRQSIEDEEEFLEEQLASGQIDYDEYLDKIDALEAKKKKKEQEPPKYKGEKDFKGILDRAGTEEKFDPEMTPYEVMDTIISMVKAKARRFKTGSGDYVNLENLPFFDIDDFASQVFLNMMTGKKLPGGGFGPGYLKVFDPTKNDSFYGYVNAQLGNRMKTILDQGEMTNEQFTVQVEQQVDLAQDYDSFDEFDNELYDEEDFKRKLTNPITVVDVNLQQEAVEEMKSKIENIDIASLTFKTTPNLAAATLGKHFEVREVAIQNAKSNLNSRELDMSAPKLKQAAKLIISILPNAYISEKNTEFAVSEALIGSGVGLPRNILDAFYDKGERLLRGQEGIGKKGAGLEAFELKGNITEEYFLSQLGINTEGKNIAAPKSLEARTRRAMLDLIGKLMTNTAVRQVAVDLGIDPIAINNIAAAKNPTMMSVSEDNLDMPPLTIDSKTQNYLDRIKSFAYINDSYYHDLFKEDLSSFAAWYKLDEKLLKLGLEVIYNKSTTKSIFISMLGDEINGIPPHPAYSDVFRRLGFSENEIDLKRRELAYAYSKIVNNAYEFREKNPIVQKYADEWTKTFGHLFEGIGYTQASVRDLSGRTYLSEGVDFNIDKLKQKNITNKTKNKYKETLDRLKKVGGRIQINHYSVGKVSSSINDYLNKSRKKGASYGERISKSIEYTNNSKKYNPHKRSSHSLFLSTMTDFINASTKEDAIDRIAYSIYATANVDTFLRNIAEFGDGLSGISEEYIAEVDKINNQIDIERSEAAKRLGMSEKDARALANKMIRNGQELSEDLKIVKKPYEPYVRGEHWSSRSLRGVTDVNHALSGRLYEYNTRYKAGIINNKMALDIDRQILRVVSISKTKDVSLINRAVSQRTNSFNKIVRQTNATKFSLTEEELEESYFGKKKSGQKLEEYLGDSMDKILQDATGIDPKTQISEASAKLNSETRKSRFRWMSPSAEDFRGFWYSFLGKGNAGNAQIAFFDKYLTDPYNRAFIAIAHARQYLSRNFKDLNKEYEDIKKSLIKKSGFKNFTNDQILRVYLYSEAGTKMEALGLNDEDLKGILDLVKSNKRMLEYAEYLIEIADIKEKWVAPRATWLVGNIHDDVERVIDTVKRSQYLVEWQQNINAMFTPNNLNKIESHYGSYFREMLEERINAMRTGQSVPEKTTKEIGRFQRWLTGAVATTMFLNRKSAMLQLISTFNYLNWTDNNPLMAARAFANFPQFASDFIKIFNSDYLKERRGGLKMEVEASVLAGELRKGGVEGFRGLVNRLLKAGFTLTQIGDTMAISLGGATFYRNRKNTYLRNGLSEQEAHDKAWVDFVETSETSQQSARPDKLSQQQTTTTGRVFLAWQNTPMQYYRIYTRTILDLVNGRGDFKTNVSKLSYYTFIQGLLFSFLQQGLFAFLGDVPDDEEEKEEFLANKETKTIRTINSTLDTMLKGSGLSGVYIATVKNAILEFINQEKKGFKADQVYTFLELANVSPPIGVKARTLYRGAYMNYKYNDEIIEDMGYGIDNPAYDIVGALVDAGVNVPMDKVINQLRSLKEAADSDNEYWQRIMMLVGYTERDAMIENEEIQALKLKKTKEKKEAAKAKRKAESAEKKRQREAERMLPGGGREVDLPGGSGKDVALPGAEQMPTLPGM